MGIERAYLNIIKVIFDKPAANIILNSGKLEVFPLRSGTKYECLLSPLLLNTVLEVLDTARKEKKKKKSDTFRLERKKLNCHTVFICR